MEVIAIPKAVVPTLDFGLLSGRRWAIISVSSHPNGFPKIPDIYPRMGILQLCFHDINEVTKKLDDDDEYILFSEDHAAKIVDFVNSMIKGKVELLIVHCEAGVSRSPAIAAAITKMLGRSDELFFSKYTPNSFVYKTMLNVLNKRGLLKCGTEEMGKSKKNIA